MLLRLLFKGTSCEQLLSKISNKKTTLFYDCALEDINDLLDQVEQGKININNIPFTYLLSSLSPKTLEQLLKSLDQRKEIPNDFKKRLCSLQNYFSQK